jgi:transcriptional regulator with XRE-family HTH domain
MHMERPADIIQRLRTDRGLSKAQACGIARVSRSTWSAVEAGSRARPRPATRIRIARALGVPPSSSWSSRPRPLHLDDVDDPRWEPAVRRMAERLDREGTSEERQRFGARLLEVLDCLGPRSREGASEASAWPDLRAIGSGLTTRRPSPPIAIVGGKLVEREPFKFTRAPGGGVISAGRRGADVKAPDARGRPDSG